jgi:hypothetical protein
MAMRVELVKEHAMKKNEVLDKLFLAAAQDPRSVRATLKIEKTDGSARVEREFLVDARVITRLTDLLQALDDDAMRRSGD